MPEPQHPQVEMYAKRGCPYCLRAKDLLQSKGVLPQEYPAAEEAALFQQMLARSGGRRTFPQIFIAGQHIGGCDDLYALEAQGALEPLLQGREETNA